VKRAAWFGRRHPVYLVALVVAVVLTSGAAAWAIDYDSHASKELLPGTVISGIPVGGMNFDTAVARVRDEVEAPLHRTITVTGDGFQAQTTAWDLGLHVDVPSVVKRAMHRSTEGNLLERIWHHVFSHPTKESSATPKWGDGQLSGLLDKAKDAVAVEPKNASMSTSTGWVTITPAKAGRSLDLEASRKALLEAVRLHEDNVRLVTKDEQPEVGADAFSTVILVRAGENKLYLYQNGSIAQSWPVATGQAEFPTPTGNWKVVQKLVNPVWINPNSSWSKSMPATIPGGPGNPLGTHALALNASGILIHATSDDGSIGYSASHGCIRMHESDEAELFGQVPTGTPVAIVNAGAPKVRGAEATPAPADAVQTAAVQF
jgi:lipoprotein-anchoring transpeptidase ErfK/SrfK